MVSFYVIGCPCLLADLSAKDHLALQRHQFYLHFDNVKVATLETPGGGGEWAQPVSASA